MLTGSRAEYGLLYWTIRRIHEDPDLELLLFVTGTHLSPDFGLTVNEIEADGFPIAARFESVYASDSQVGTATSIGLGTVKAAEALAEHLPDILVVLGDRTEVLATTVAALPMLIPVAHLHAGESTEGAIDESTRHAVTKLSHICFAATDYYANRIMQLGEEPWRVHVSGATGLEHIYRTALPSKKEIETELGIDLSHPVLLVTQHPVTLRAETQVNAALDIAEVLGAVEDTGLPVVITYPNSDAGGRAIIEYIERFKDRYPGATIRVNLGTKLYLGLLRHISVLVGNSSSGIIEAGSFGLPVVNVGDRQKGRVRGPNVIDVATDQTDILDGIHKALDPSFRRYVASQPNPYDSGEASKNIVRVLKEVKLGQELLQKRLPDLPQKTVHSMRNAGVMNTNYIAFGTTDGEIL